MTDKEVKEWLNRAYDIETIIKKDREEIQKLTELIDTGFGIDYQKPNIQSSPSGDAPYENKVLKIIEHRSEYEKRLMKQLEIKREIRSKIDKLTENREKTVLICRHCHFMEWIDIAFEMNYSKRQCFRIYDLAVKNLKKVLK